MRNPFDLLAYRAAEDVSFEIYRVTASFPPEEKYGLTNQMRRASVSVFSNLAEGCSRSSQRDFARFVEMSVGSAMELRAQLRFANRLGWTKDLEATATIEKMVNDLVMALIRLQKSLRTLKP